MTIFGSSNGTAGQTLSTLNVPATIILDSNYNHYIADGDNHRVLLASNGQTSGSIMAGTTGRIILKKNS